MSLMSCQINLRHDEGYNCTAEIRLRANRRCFVAALSRGMNTPFICVIRRPMNRR